LIDANVFLHPNNSTNESSRTIIIQHYSASDKNNDCSVIKERDSVHDRPTAFGLLSAVIIYLFKLLKGKTDCDAHTMAP